MYERKGRKGGGNMFKIFLYERYSDGKLWHNYVGCRLINWTVPNKLNDDDIQEIYEIIKTRRRPKRREYIKKFCESLKGEKILSLCELSYIKQELTTRQEKLKNSTRDKLQIMYDKMQCVLNKTEEIEKEFWEVGSEVKKFTRYSHERINRAIFKLYDDLNLKYPMTDWNNGILTINSGRNIKGLLIYRDPAGFAKGIVLGSLRFVDEEEIEKEISQ